MRRAYIEKDEALSLDGIRDFPDVGFELSNAGLHDSFPK